jgi:hypothetical protein
MFFTPVSELRRNKKGNYCPMFILIWEAKYTITVMQQFGVSGNEMIHQSTLYCAIVTSQVETTKRICNSSQLITAGGLMILM